MRMKPVEGGLEIGPGATVELKPGGFHLMFMDLKEPLKEGQTIKGTLVFEKAGSVAVEYAGARHGRRSVPPNTSTSAGEGSMTVKRTSRPPSGLARPASWCWW